MKSTGLSKTKRIQELLDMVALQSLVWKGVSPLNATLMNAAQKGEHLQHVFCDVSQNPRYASFTNHSGISPCLATSTILYSFARDRVVLPFELLMFMGHRRGIKIPPSAKPSQIRDLAGEGMHLASLGSVVWALYSIKGMP